MTTDEAPGPLEDVRALLNTTGLANDDARTPFDRLDDLVADWSPSMSAAPAPGPAEVEAVRRLRDDLREVLGEERPGGALPSWLDEIPLAPRLGADGERAVRFAAEPPSTAGALLGAVLEAVDDGTWHRLRACPDCRFVFYDASRRGGRTWCRMTRDDEHGRSCGSLAKARAKRERDRAG